MKLAPLLFLCCKDVTLNLLLAGRWVSCLTCILLALLCTLDSVPEVMALPRQKKTSHFLEVMNKDLIGRNFESLWPNNKINDTEFLYFWAAVLDISSCCEGQNCSMMWDPRYCLRENPSGLENKKHLLMQGHFSQPMYNLSSIHLLLQMTMRRLLHSFLFFIDI